MSEKHCNKCEDFEGWFEEAIWGNEDFKECLWAAWQAASPKWQPIETAPKDGTRVLLYQSPIRQHVFQAVADGFWCNNVWVWPYVHKEPTHWMPLPQPPEE